METLLKIGRKVIPTAVFNFLQPKYHWLLSRLAALIYGFPSNKMIVIGVTGTKGKSTTCYLLAKILEDAGQKVGMSSGIIYKIADKEWLNDEKMTMVGRFKLQSLLKKMVRAGCKYSIVETTSEGIKLYRHLGINYDIALFTNLHPEHIESHGSFEAYREAKGKLFKHLTERKRKKQFVKKVIIANLDDKNAQYFLSFKADEKYAYSVRNQELRIKNQGLKEIIIAKDVKQKFDGSEFMIHDSKFMIQLLGEINVYNALAVITIARVLGAKLETIERALEKVSGVPGRLEFIDEGQDFKVIVDYAHDPESLRQVFAVLQNISYKKQDTKIVHVFGATGGGRDVSKRAVMGEIADKNADEIILTNDDPYTDDPSKIIQDINKGIKDQSKVEMIVDRRQAIARALMQARQGDIVLITGKGSEQAIVLADGKHSWDDRQVVREELAKVR